MLVETLSPPPTTFQSTSPMPFPTPAAARHLLQVAFSCPFVFAETLSPPPTTFRSASPPFPPQHFNNFLVCLSPTITSLFFGHGPRRRGGRGVGWVHHGILEKKHCHRKRGGEASGLRPSPGHEHQFTTDSTWWLGMETAMQLKELGEKLDAALADLADALAKLLKQAAKCLHGIEQSPGSSVMETIQSCLKAITREELLKHQDEDVKVHLGTCFCEITRITAPKAPYSDDVLRRVAILETVARYRACVVMLDLECNDLNIDMF